MRPSFVRSIGLTASILAAVGASRAGQLRGRLILIDRPAAGVSVSAIPYETPTEEARRDARRGPPPPPLASVTTGLDGSFTLAVTAQPGEEKLFTVRAEGGGAVAVALAGVFDASEIEDLGEHVVLKGEKLAGKVTDASGAPVGNAEVVLLAQPDRLGDPEIEAAPRRTLTSVDGGFRFDDASASGNTLAVERVGLQAGRVTQVKAGTLARPIVLGRGVSVSGIVRKADRVSPAAGALVRVEARVATRWVETESDGRFTLTDAPTGAVTVIADDGETGYVEQGGVKLPLVDGKPLALVLEPPATLLGRTVDAKSGRPVPRTRIEVRSAGRKRVARSGPDGAYALRALPPRSWSLRADEPRYVVWTRRSVPLAVGETKKVDVPLVLGATLSGRVIDSDGKPVADARGSLIPTGNVPPARTLRRWLRAEPPAFRSRTDGTFKANRLAPGESQILEVSHPDFERARVGGLTLLPGAAKSGVSVVLTRGAVVTGTVKDGDDRPVPGADVEIYQAPSFAGVGARAGVRAIGSLAASGNAERKGDTTGPEGRFTIRGVAPGEYQVTVKRVTYATEVVTVKVPAGGSPKAVDVTLHPGATISGRVVRRSGEGAEGFVVSADARGSRAFGAAFRSPTDPPTAPDGGFTIEGLKAGQTYDLRLFGPAGPAEGKRGVTAPSYDVRIAVAGAGRITGTALEAASGTPLTDFTVSYEPDRGGGFRAAARGGALGVGGPGQPVAAHGDDGAFTLEDVPAGTWSVVVTAPGCQPAHVGGVVVEEGSTREHVEVRVARGAALKGRVLDAETGAATPNAAVSLAPTGQRPAMGAVMQDVADGGVGTDAEGRFEFDGIGAGEQMLHATHPDYADAVQSVDVKEDGASVEIRMSQGGVLAGVVALDTGQPAPGADVSLSPAGGAGFGLGALMGGPSSITDGAGSFRFAHLSAGRYTLTASLGSRASAPLDVVLEAGRSQESLALQLQSGVTIEGTLTGLPDGLLGSTTVTASASGAYFQSTRPAADGHFEIDNVPAGLVTLRGTADDPAGSTRSATRQVTASTDQPVLSVQLAFDQGLTLSGRITRSSQPVAGANVFAVLAGGGGRQASVVTDDAGAYRLDGLQEGTYTVSALSMASGSTRRQSVTLTSDEVLDIAFPSAKIAGQVVDAGGKAPLADATVTIAARDPGATGGIGQRPATTDSDGQFSFSNLDEGAYTLITSRPDYQLDKRDVSASEQGTGGLVIELARGSGIGIRVQDGLFALPLRGVMVRVLDPRGSTVFGPSAIALDGEGQGAIPSLQPGTYTLLAGASGYAPARLDGVNVPSSTVAIFLTPGGSVLVQAGPRTLAAGTATGTITNAAGQPAVLSLANLEGRLAVSQPSLTLRNLAPGSYVLSIPAVEFTSAFAVSEAGTTVLRLP
ncbi:MAG: carboxypeptidase regulatory-like domain-containing protein [Acidobacteriia bacterium]|nr:carboxypeptidase regulatory-like domain-containing protein [Terriglobia bacterium]